MKFFNPHEKKELCYTRSATWRVDCLHEKKCAFNAKITMDYIFVVISTRSATWRVDCLHEKKCAFNAKITMDYIFVVISTAIYGFGLPII